jgi:hypothetical protein
MDPFFMYVSIGALILLIIILIVVGVAMTQLHAADAFPPIENACPDYWDVSSNPQYCGIPLNGNRKNIGNIASSASGVEKSNIQNIGLCTGPKTNFGCTGATDGKTHLNLGENPVNGFQYSQLSNNSNWSVLYPGLTERCAKKSWAKTMNITWDGVTNYNGC